MSPSSLPLSLNGYTDLPPGKVASIVTYLDMRQRPRLRRIAKPEGWRFERLNQDLPRYRALYRRIGEPWLWFSRTVMAEDALAAILGNPRVEAYALNDGKADLGLVELDFRTPGEAELAYFGLIPEAVGKGLGQVLMNEAIRLAFAKPIKRLFVHTCSLDHPSALPFYIRSGFVPYKLAIEVADDPRLLGFLPLEACPHAPVFKPPATAKTRRSTARPRKTKEK